MDKGVIVGIDEVGRGAWAGPLVVAAVTLGKEEEKKLRQEIIEAAKIKKILDSKKLTSEKRELIFACLKDKLAWGIGMVEANEIDRVGLSRAARQASDQALAELCIKGVEISEVMADAGLRHNKEEIWPTKWFVKGDETVLPITIASIMAKVFRDRLMRRLSNEYSGYGWERNVGYGTAMHREAIIKLGKTPLHRSSFITFI